jgi:hypothetical protein
MADVCSDFACLFAPLGAWGRRLPAAAGRMADVLTLLRNALSAKQTVEVDGAKTTLVFPDGSKHPIGAPSAYRQNRGQGDPYTIGAVWFYCTNPKLGFGQYRTQARPYGLINRIDQKDLLDYVTGETDSSVAVKEAETIFDAVDTRDAKRARLDDDADAAAAGGMDADAAAAAAAIEVEEEDFLPKCSTVEDILGREKSLSTRNSILLAPDPKHFSSVEGLYAATMKRKKEASKRRGPSPKSKSNREVERDLDRLRLGAKDGYYANRTEQNADAAMRSRVGGGVHFGPAPPTARGSPRPSAAACLFVSHRAALRVPPLDPLRVLHTLCRCGHQLWRHSCVLDQLRQQVHEKGRQREAGRRVQPERERG